MKDDALVTLLAVVFLGQGYGPQQAARRAYKDAPRLAEGLREAAAELEAEAAAKAARERSTAETQRLKEEADAEHRAKLEAALREADENP